MKKIFILIILIIMLSIVGLLWWKNGVLSPEPQNKKETIFVIQKGEGVREIANKLKRENLIKDPIVFFLLIKQLGLDGKIQAGDFRLSPSMTANEVAQNLTHGTIDIWVTIPEGQRADEIADTLSKKIPSYQESWRNILVENEGYLFPDTYLIPKDADLNLIVSIMTGNFEKKYSEIETADKSNLSKQEVVTLASLIEREAKFPSDRPLVASVLLNRLKISMSLQIDATVQYALGYQPVEKNWWKKELTNDDLRIKSPYNTYLNSGLPPTPIASPGIDSLKAILNPIDTDYLYYISDSKGHLVFSKTLEEHNNNIKKYGL
ncbi:MAG: endolytic transglycosylase MltG [bacterium]|nr:endolytic transglycosylase MltG [bacterium]